MVTLPTDHYLDIHAEDDVRVRGTRVGIEHLLEGYQAGAIAEQLAIEFPSVTLEQVYGVITYYLRHRQAVDEYLRDWRQASAARQANIRETPKVVAQLRQLSKEQAVG